MNVCVFDFQVFDWPVVSSGDVKEKTCSVFFRNWAMRFLGVVVDALLHEVAPHRASLFLVTSFAVLIPFVHKGYRTWKGVGLCRESALSSLLLSSRRPSEVRYSMPVSSWPCPGMFWNGLDFQGVGCMVGPLLVLFYAFLRWCGMKWCG